MWDQIVATHDVVLVTQHRPTWYGRCATGLLDRTSQIAYDQFILAYLEV